MTTEQLIDEIYCSGYLGMTDILIPYDGWIRIRRAWLGTNPKSAMHGLIKAVLEKDGRFYSATFHVYSPHQRPHDANHMTCLEEIVMKEDAKLGPGFEWLQLTRTPFGDKAFWDYTPDSCLDGDDLSLRLLMHAMRRWCIDNRICRKLRTEYLKYEKKNRA